MTKLLFVSHGNICRSPIAECVMKSLVEKAGLKDKVLIESAATSPEDIGKPIFTPVRRMLMEHGLSCEEQRTRLLENHDYENFDLLIGMDRKNLRDMYQICGGDYAEKMHLLLDYTDTPGSIEDPWYSEDFVTCWMAIQKGCRGLLEALKTYTSEDK